jgi:hypothetical protein
VIDASAQLMQGPFMEAGSKRLLPLIDKYRAQLGSAVLELGPNQHPLITPDSYPGRIVYLEVSDPCLEILRERFKDTVADTVAMVRFDLNESWDGGENRLEQALRPALEGSSLGALIWSQILNYIDYEAVLRASRPLCAPGALLLVNNVMNHGADWMFHAKRPITWEEFLSTATEVGFDVLETASEPARVRDPGKVRCLAALRRR